MDILLTLSIFTGVTSLFCLLALHFVSPEFKPSWRMVSEYALGKYKWLLTIFFCLWGVSSLLLALYLAFLVQGIWSWLGVLLLALSGIGAFSGGVFDINHKNHGLAFALGVPTLPIAALLLNYHLLNVGLLTQKSTLFFAHATWISLVIMAGSMMLMFAGFKKAGITWDKDSAPMNEVPKGVIALGGYANRLLVLSYALWVLIIAYLL